MSISRINFTAKNNLLNEMQNRTVAAQNAVTPPKIQEEQVRETAQENATEKNHKVRNWSIGLGSAAVLISLGVLGRRGKLGEGIQKFLGGVKKNTSDIAEELETKAEELVESKKPEIKPEKPAKPQSGDSIRINEKLSQAEIDKINAELDRTIPQIDKNLLKIDTTDFKKFADEINNIDISKIEGNATIIKLPNGNTREIHIAEINPGEGKKIINIQELNPDWVKVFDTFYERGRLVSITRGNETYIPDKNFIKEIDGNLYSYTNNGKLRKIHYELPNGQSKEVLTSLSTGEIDQISYRDKNNNLIKTESFADGKLCTECFNVDGQEFAVIHNNI